MNGVYKDSVFTRILWLEVPFFPTFFSVRTLLDLKRSPPIVFWCTGASPLGSRSEAAKKLTRHQADQADQADLVMRCTWSDPVTKHVFPLSPLVAMFAFCESGADMQAENMVSIAPPMLREFLQFILIQRLWSFKGKWREMSLQALELCRLHSTGKQADWVLSSWPFLQSRLH